MVSPGGRNIASLRVGYSAILGILLLSSLVLVNAAEVPVVETDDKSASSWTPPILVVVQAALTMCILEIKHKGTSPSPAVVVSIFQSVVAFSNAEKGSFCSIDHLSVVEL